MSVKAGDKVKTGQVLGVVDTIGGETQLHFELWEETTPRDPEGWLRDQSIGVLDGEGIGQGWICSEGAQEGVGIAVGIAVGDL